MGHRTTKGAAMTAAEILARANAIADAINANPETDNWRELRRARTLADTLAQDAAALGEPTGNEAGDD